MSKHAVERIYERYGREFDWQDINAIIKAIKQGKCVFLDASKDDSLIVLILYDHSPLKLVYGYSKGVTKKGKKVIKYHIITALPLDVDEWNANISNLPLVKRYEKKSKKHKIKNKKEKGENDGTGK